MALMSAYGAIWCPYIYFNHTGSKSTTSLILRRRFALSKKESQRRNIFYH